MSSRRSRPIAASSWAAAPWPSRRPWPRRPGPEPGRSRLGSGPRWRAAARLDRPQDRPPHRSPVERSEHQNLYFHQNGYTPQGDKLVLKSATGLWLCDLKTFKLSLLVKGPEAELLFTTRHSRDVLYSVTAPKMADGSEGLATDRPKTIYAIDVDTGRPARSPRSRPGRSTRSMSTAPCWHGSGGLPAPSRCSPRPKTTASASARPSPRPWGRTASRCPSPRPRACG